MLIIRRHSQLSDKVVDSIMDLCNHNTDLIADMV